MQIEEETYIQSIEELMVLQKQINDLSLWNQPQIRQHLEIINKNIQEIQEVVKQSQQGPFLQVQAQAGNQANLGSNGKAHKQQIFNQSPLQSNSQVHAQQNINMSQKIQQANTPNHKIVLKFDNTVQNELNNAMKNFNLNIVDKLILQSDNKTQENCVICLDTLFDESQNIQQIPVVQLKCTHFFHWTCIKGIIQNNNSLKCPVCNIIQGKLFGDMPDGKMNTYTIQEKCSGYNCNTIEIEYEFKGGKRNGKYYDGTYRIAYLPNNPEGQEILVLLKRAFDQKLTFTIGTSVTTGRDNQIVWNGIHHKTSTNGGATNFGYPDQTYFDRVRQELKQKGIQ